MSTTSPYVYLPCHTSPQIHNAVNTFKRPKKSSQIDDMAETLRYTPPREASGRSSAVIPKAVDVVLQIIEQERARAVLPYREAIYDLENRLKELEQRVRSSDEEEKAREVPVGLTRDSDVDMEVSNEGLAITQVAQGSHEADEVMDQAGNHQARVASTTNQENQNIENASLPIRTPSGSRQDSAKASLTLNKVAEDAYEHLRMLVVAAGMEIVSAILPKFLDATDGANAVSDSPEKEDGLMNTPSLRFVGRAASIMKRLIAEARAFGNNDVCGLPNDPYEPFLDPTVCIEILREYLDGQSRMRIILEAQFAELLKERDAYKETLIKLEQQFGISRPQSRAPSGSGSERSEHATPVSKHGSSIVISGPEMTIPEAPIAQASNTPAPPPQPPNQPQAPKPTPRFSSPYPFPYSVQPFRQFPPSDYAGSPRISSPYVQHPEFLTHFQYFRPPPSALQQAQASPQDCRPPQGSMPQPQPRQIPHQQQRSPAPQQPPLQIVQNMSPQQLQLLQQQQVSQQIMISQKSPSPTATSYRPTGQPRQQHPTQPMPHRRPSGLAQPLPSHHASIPVSQTMQISEEHRMTRHIAAAPLVYGGGGSALSHPAFAWKLRGKTLGPAAPTVLPTESLPPMHVQQMMRYSGVPQNPYPASRSRPAS